MLYYPLTNKRFASWLDLWVTYIQANDSSIIETMYQLSQWGYGKLSQQTDTLISRWVNKPIKSIIIDGKYF